MWEQEVNSKKKKKKKKKNLKKTKEIKEKKILTKTDLLNKCIPKCIPNITAG